MDHAITEIEKACDREAASTKMLAAIESPLGITRANQIAFASKRLVGIALCAEYYVRHLNTERSPEGIELLLLVVLFYKRHRTAGIQPPVDTVYSNATTMKKAA